jgi:uncharacterized protein DUF1569
MPPRQLDLKDLSAVSAEVDRLHRGGYEKLGQWDLTQACDHLGFFIKGSLDGWRIRVPWLFKFLFGRMSLRRILTQRKMKIGGFTPYKPVPPPGQDEAAAVESFKGLIQRLVAKDATFHDSPFFGHLTPEQWREIHLIHCNHHLAFLQPKG